MQGNLLGVVAGTAAPGNIGSVPLSPPYALASPRFRFRALAALVGRSPLGGEREVALATLLAARLVVGALPPVPLPNGARAWFAALAVPPAFRQSLTRLLDATTSLDRDRLETALRTVIDVSAPHLDAPALSELREVMRVLAQRL